MVKKAFVQLLLRRISGGLPSDDTAITENEIALWVDAGIAASAMKAYSESVNLEQVAHVPEGYYITIKGLALTEDTDTGRFKATLPGKPYGLPAGYDITSLQVQGNGKLSQPAIRLPLERVSYYKLLPHPKNANFFWPEGNILYMESATDLTGKKVVVTMAGQSTDLNTEMSVSEDQLPWITEYIFKTFLPTLNIPADNQNDGK